MPSGSKTLTSEVGKGLTGDNRHDQRQQRVARPAVGVLRADREVWSWQLHDPLARGLIGDASEIAGDFGIRWLQLKK
jgi:hypothetical protein